MTTSEKLLDATLDNTKSIIGKIFQCKILKKDELNGCYCTVACIEINKNGDEISDVFLLDVWNSKLKKYLIGTMLLIKSINYMYSSRHVEVQILNSDDGENN